MLNDQRRRPRRPQSNRSSASVNGLDSAVEVVARRFFIDHLLFAESGSYRRLLAWEIEPYLHRVGRLHLSFMCSGRCCEAMNASKDAAWLLSGKWAHYWVTMR